MHLQNRLLFRKKNSTMLQKVFEWNPVVYKDMVQWYQIFYTPKTNSTNIWKKQVLIQNIPLEIIKSKQESNSPWANFILFLKPPNFENEQQVELFVNAIHEQVVKTYLSSDAFSLMIDLYSPLQHHLLKIAKEKFCNTTYESYGMFLPIDKSTPLPKISSISSQFQVIPFTADINLLTKHYALFLETFGVPPNYIERETNTMIESTDYTLTHRIIILDDDKTVATLSWTFSQETQHTFLNEITVHQNYRNQGIGYYITVFSIHQMVQLYPQCKGVSLNATAMGVPLYEKMGFIYTSPLVYCQHNQDSVFKMD